MPQTYEELLENAGWIRSLCRSLVRDPHRAEDAAQDTWVRALEGGPREPRALKQWLRTVATNAVFQRLRRDATRREREERVLERPPDPLSPAEALEKAGMRRMIVDAVLALEEPYRTTIVLRYFEELPSREVARIQGITTSTVRSQTQRALERLRRRLDSEYAEEEHGRSLDAMLLIMAAAPRVPVAGADGTSGTVKMGRSWLPAAVPSVVLLAVIGSILSIGTATWWLVGSRAVEAAEDDARTDSARRAHDAGAGTGDLDEESAPKRAVTGVVGATVRVFEASTGAPVQNAEVSALYGRADADGALLTQRVEVGRTNERGELSLALPADAADVERARTRLVLVHEEYLDWQLTPHEVAEGVEGRPLDVPLLPLGTLEVEVVGPDDVPLAGLVLRARPLLERSRSLEEPLLRRGRTTSAGSVELPRLPCGIPTRVEVSADRGRDGFAFLDAEVVIDPLARRERLVMKAPVTAALAGLVLDVEGEPEVVGLRWFGPVAPGETRSVERFLQTREDGRFLLDFLRPGDGTLWIGDQSTPLTLTLQPGELRDLGTISLEQEVVLRGVVRFTEDIGLGGLGGLAIRAFGADGFSRDASTAPDGSFEIGARVGELELVVASLERAAADGSPRVLASVRVNVPVDDLVVNLVDPLARPDPGLLEPADLLVRVLDEHEDPVQGAIVGYETTAGEHGEFVTDQEGTIRVSDLSPGVATVVALRGGLGTSQRSEIVLASGEPTEAQLVLLPFATLRLRTEDPAGTLDAAGVLLRMRSDGAWDWSTDADGVRVYEELAPGTYHLWWNGTHRLITLAAGEDEELVLHAPPDKVELELLRNGARATDLEGGFLVTVDPTSPDRGVALRAEVHEPGLLRVARCADRALLVVRRIGPVAGRVLVVPIEAAQGKRIPVELPSTSLEVRRGGGGPAPRLVLVALPGAELEESYELDFLSDEAGLQVFPHVPAGATLRLEGLDGTTWRSREVAFPTTGSATVSWP